MAVLRIDVAAHGADAEAIVSRIGQDGTRVHGGSLDRLSLPSEQRRFLVVEVPAPSDQVTDLQYRVAARRGDGSTTELRLSYRIPPDDPDSCQMVGDYFQCMGQAIEEVQP